MHKSLEADSKQNLQTIFLETRISSQTFYSSFLDKTKVVF